MKKYISGILLAVFVLSFALAPTAKASGEKFMINGLARSDSTHFVVVFEVLTGTTVSMDTYAYFSVSGIDTEDEIQQGAVNAVVDWANTNEDTPYPGTVASDIIFAFKPISLSTVASTGSYNDLLNKPTRSFNNTPSHSFVTTAGAANGFQISATKDTQVSYAVTVSSAVQIGVATNVTGYAALEIASTNSSTAGDWKEVSRVGTGQNIGLAIALSSTQSVTAPLSAVVPAGYYARIRTVNSNGTPTYTFVGGQEVQL